MNSRPWSAEEEASVPRSSSLETENESFDADLRRHHRSESNESFGLVQTGHHNCSRVHDRTAGEEDWTRHAHVDDANDARRARTSNGLWTTHNRSYPRHILWTRRLGAVKLGLVILSRLGAFSSFIFSQFSL